MKIIIFLNTYAKMQDYNLSNINLLDYTPIAIIPNKELSLFHDSYNAFFKNIFAVKTFNIEETKIIITELFDKYNLISKDVKLVCLSEDNLLLAGALRDYFKISGMGYAQSELFRNKIKMKDALQKQNIIMPKYIDLVNINYNDFEDLFNSITSILGNKFVIKPKSEFGGKDVKIITSYEIFRVAIIEVVKQIDLYEAETFIEGSLYHIDSVYVGGVPLFQVCCKYSHPNFDFQLGLPSLSFPMIETDEIVKKARLLSNKVVDTLNYLNGTSHLEFFINDKQELVFLEIAARTPGGNTTPVYEEMFGFNMLNADLNINLGLRPELPIHNGKYYITGIFPTQKGLVKKINKPILIGETKINWKIKEGDKLKECTSLRDIAAEILVTNDDYMSACSDFKYLSNFKVVE